MTTLADTPEARRERPCSVSFGHTTHRSTMICVWRTTHPGCSPFESVTQTACVHRMRPRSARMPVRVRMHHACMPPRMHAANGRRRPGETFCRRTGSSGRHVRTAHLIPSGIRSTRLGGSRVYGTTCTVPGLALPPPVGRRGARHSARIARAEYNVHARVSDSAAHLSCLRGGGEP